MNPYCYQPPDTLLIPLRAAVAANTYRIVMRDYRPSRALQQQAVTLDGETLQVYAACQCFVALRAQVAQCMQGAEWGYGSRMNTELTVITLCRVWALTSDPNLAEATGYHYPHALPHGSPNPVKALQQLETARVTKGARHITADAILTNCVNAMAAVLLRNGVGLDNGLWYHKLARLTLMAITVVSPLLPLPLETLDPSV